MTLLSGGDGTKSAGTTICAGCAQPVEAAQALIHYGHQGSRFLHSACLPAGPAGRSGTAGRPTA